MQDRDPYWQEWRGGRVLVVFLLLMTLVVLAALITFTGGLGFNSYR